MPAYNREEGCSAGVVQRACSKYENIGKGPSLRASRACAQPVDNRETNRLSGRITPIVVMDR